MVVIDFFGYLPFVLIYDKMMCAQEITSSEEQNIPKPLHYSYFTLAYLGLQKGFFFNDQKRNSAKLALSTMQTEIKDNRIAVKAEKAENKRIEKEAEVRIRAEKVQLKLARKNGQEVVNQAVEITAAKELVRVLVICYGAGTSAMMAASAEKGARAHGITNFQFDAAAYGTHQDKIKAADLVILSPQVKMYIDDIQRSAPSVKIISTNGRQYADATKDKEKAYELLKENLPQTYFKD
jgi:lactose PTS system EIICB component